MIATNNNTHDGTKYNNRMLPRRNVDAGSNNRVSFLADTARLPPQEWKPRCEKPYYDNY